MGPTMSMLLLSQTVCQSKVIFHTELWLHAPSELSAHKCQIDIKPCYIFHQY